MSENFWKPDICIYHGPDCADGFGAAYAVWKRWGDEVDYVPAQYGNPTIFDVRPLEDIKGKRIIMVDFSYPYDVMRALGTVAESIIVLDHHKTAEKNLQEWGAKYPPTNLHKALSECNHEIALCLMQNTLPIIAWFDMTKSGARLAWEFCHPGRALPELLAYIEDRDLWRFALPYSKHVSAAIQSYDKHFERWDDWIEAGNSMLHSLIHQGGAINRARDQNIKALMRQSYMKDIGGYEVPVVNAPYQYASDLAHELLIAHPDAPFAAAWFKRGDGMIQYSLRSEDSREDVSMVAAMFGGGGHRNAAGFEAVERLTP